jgi:hypothetical protein
MRDLKEHLEQRARVRRTRAIALNNENVRSVALCYAYVYVRFKDGTSERWVHKKHYMAGQRLELPNKPWAGKDIQISNQYNSNQYDNEWVRKAHFIRYREWKEANFISQRLVIHDLAMKIAKEGWIEPEFPVEELNDEIQRLMDTNLRRLIQNGTARCTKKHGFKTTVQYTDFAERYENNLIDCFKDPGKIARATSMILRSRRSATKYRIMVRLNKLYGVSYVDPNFYRIALRAFGLSNSVVADPNGDGSKVLACMLEGCKYYSYNHMSRLSSHLRYDLNKMDDNIKCDCAILSKYSNMEEINKWRDIADIVLVHVTGDIDKVPRPDKFIKSGFYSYIFCYL